MDSAKSVYDIFYIATRFDWKNIRSAEEDRVNTREDMQQKLVVKSEEDTDFRARLLTDPHSALKEVFGVDLPESFNVVVHEEDALTAHLVLPAADELSDIELQQATGGLFGPECDWL